MNVHRDDRTLDQRNGGIAATPSVAPALGSSLDAEDFLEPPTRAAVRAATGNGGIDHGVRPTLLGPWRVGSAIASGGMGTVYDGWRADGAFEKRVAVKVLHASLATPRLRDRFRRERATLARLEHPSITRLLDGGEAADGRPYLVMEFVDGVPIDRACAERALDVRGRVALMRDVCTAVAEAHRQLVVHRDLKPGNVLVDRDGSVKLVDFGVARLLESTEAPTLPASADAGTERPTSVLPRTADLHTLARALTPAYASPEQLRGEPATTVSDVYSLGVLLHELVTGRRPDPPRLPSAVASTHADAVVRSRARAVRGDLDAVIGSALAPDPDDRMVSARALAEELTHWLDGQPVRSRPAGTLRRLTMTARRHPAVTACIAVAIGTTVMSLMLLATALVRAERDRMAAEQARGDAREVLSFYERMLVESNPYRVGGPVTVVDLLEHAEDALEHGTHDRPRVEIGIRLAAARTASQLMQWDRVERHGRRALTLLRADPEYDPLVLAECLSLVGRASCQEQRAGAVALQEEALAIRRDAFGNRHPLVAESMANLAYARWNDPSRHRDHAGAERLYRAALTTFAEVGVPGCQDAARCTMSLGFLYHRLGRDDEAADQYRRALELYAALPVTEDLYEHATWGLLARLEARRRRMDEAAEATRRQVALLDPGLPTERWLRRHWALVAFASRDGDAPEHRAAIRAALHAELRAVRERADHADGAAPAMVHELERALLSGGDEDPVARDVAARILDLARDDAAESLRLRIAARELAATPAGVVSPAFEDDPDRERGDTVRTAHSTPPEPIDDPAWRLLVLLGAAVPA